MQKCFKCSHALMLKWNLGRVMGRTEPTKLNFPSVDGNRISVLAIMKKLKNGCHFLNTNCMEKFQITDPPKVWVSGFSECEWKWNISVGHYEKIEKWLPFH